MLIMLMLIQRQFQSTLPREERHIGYLWFEEFDISIHAPTRGATEYVEKHKTIDNISIHAPTRGATRDGFVELTVDKFQSTLPREERQQYCTKNLFIFIQYRQ